MAVANDQFRLEDCDQLLTLTLDGDGPLHRQIYRALRQAIVERRLGAGASAPPTRALAAELRVSRTVVLLAYDQLAAEGYLAGRRGSGTYVQAVPSSTSGAGAPAVPSAIGAIAGRSAPSRRRRDDRLSAFGQRLADARARPLASAYASDRPPLPYDFRYGMPSLVDFPLQGWQRAVSRRSRRAPARAYDYSHPLGSPALRAALAGYLARARGVSCSPEQILVVGGSQQGADLAARVLVDPGDRVAVEEPGFEGARNAFAAVPATVVPVPVDGEGLDPSRLDDRPGAVRVVYVTPSHQYPLGGVMSYGRRAALLAWAERTGAWVIEDDYDGEYRFDTRPFPALKALDRDERVLYLGTFSKVMFPSLRLGHLVLPPGLVEPFARAKTLADGGSPRLEQDVLAEFIESGAFERHVRRSRSRNAERRAVLLDAIERQLGDRVRVSGEAVGLHVVMWLCGVPGTATGRMVRRAAEQGVGVYSVTPHFLVPPREAGLILGYAALSPKDIRTGIARLARAWA